MSTIELLENLDLPTTSDELADMTTIHQGHCCNCVYDEHGYRVWVCRVANGVTVEAIIDGRWENISGDCGTILN